MTPEEMKLKEKEIELEIEKIKQQQNNTTKTITIEEPTSEKITKRTAAIELIKVQQAKYKLGIIGIVGSFITAIISSWNLITGAITAGIITMGIAWIIIQSKKEITRLQTTYNINLKAK